MRHPRIPRRSPPARTTLTLSGKHHCCTTQYANLSGDPYQRTQEALDHDPSCVMAHCLRGLLAALGQSDPAAVSACLAAAERELEAVAAHLGAEPGADLPGGRVGRTGERERVFAATLRAWSAGRWREVRVVWSGVRVVVVAYDFFSLSLRIYVVCVASCLRDFLRRRLRCSRFLRALCCSQFLCISPFFMAFRSLLAGWQTSRARAPRLPDCVLCRHKDTTQPRFVANLPPPVGLSPSSYAGRQDKGRAVKFWFAFWWGETGFLWWFVVALWFQHPSGIKDLSFVDKEYSTSTHLTG